MSFAWLSSRRPSPHQRLSFRPSVQSLDERIVPANAHFITELTSASVSATGVLTVNFKEAGLGDSELVTIELTGTVDATYQWFNHGGNKPMGEPFSVHTVIDVSGDFRADDNGQVTGSFTITPPPPPADFLTHPHADNWIAVMTVTYSDLTLTDTTSVNQSGEHPTISLPGGSATTIIDA